MWFRQVLVKDKAVMVAVHDKHCLVTVLLGLGSGWLMV